MSEANKFGMILVASDKRNKLRDFGYHLGKKLGRKARFFHTDESILEFIKKERQDLLIVVDEATSNLDSLGLIKKIISINALVGITVVSDTSQKKFNTKFEGLGILMQLSNPPTHSETDSLYQKIETVNNLIP